MGRKNIPQIIEKNEKKDEFRLLFMGCSFVLNLPNITQCHSSWLLKKQLE